MVEANRNDGLRGPQAAGGNPRRLIPRSRHFESQGRSGVWLRPYAIWPTDAMLEAVARVGDIAA
jgi:hypothetical protein